MDELRTSLNTTQKRHPIVGWVPLLARNIFLLSFALINEAVLKR
jgi:hypothetical protein